MNQGKWIILLILVLFSIPASAEFYKFIDEEGNVQFTDDLTKVPLNQREGVRKYIEFQFFEFFIIPLFNLKTYFGVIRIITVLFFRMPFTTSKSSNIADLIKKVY